jgi:hypothetical protein
MRSFFKVSVRTSLLGVMLLLSVLALLPAISSLGEAWRGVRPRGSPSR